MEIPTTNTVLVYGGLYLGWTFARNFGSFLSRAILYNTREMAACATSASAITHASAVAMAVSTPSHIPPAISAVSYDAVSISTNDSKSGTINAATHVWMINRTPTSNRE